MLVVLDSRADCLEHTMSKSWNDGSALFAALFPLLASGFNSTAAAPTAIDTELRAVLAREGFTGTVESTLPQRLGRPVDLELANLGRLLWFDKSGGLRKDNTCAGCHAPSHGLGDSQSIAIGVQNNNVVGLARRGPRNQRRTPTAVNTVFYPKLMWNGRFFAPSGDPFDNSMGFTFPPPEGTSLFPPFDPAVTHLLIAQAHIPPTELVEVAGFTGTRGTIGPEFDQFDDGVGDPVPPPDGSGFRNAPIRAALLDRLNGSAAYRLLFGEQFPEVAAGAPIDFTMFGRAIAEFEFTLVFANAPLDRYARGNSDAMSESQKHGALTFFGKGGCVQCHRVAGDSNEMFSDFENHVAGVPQIAPVFGVGTSNMLYDGPGHDEDFGLEQISGNPQDRYRFRTSPLRNLAVQPAFFHNGAFARLDDAVRYHLDAISGARTYDPKVAGVAADLQHRQGPIDPVLERLDPRLRAPVILSDGEFSDLIAFLRFGLLDTRALPAALCQLIPSELPSGIEPLQFDDCPPPRQKVIPAAAR
jgi:cytochrome c peroxidase